MPGLRSLLPAVPVGLVIGVGVLYLVGAAVGEPWVAGLLAVVVAGATAFGVAGYLVGWTERSRRVVGYLASAAVGLDISGVLVTLAVASSLCGTFGEECSPGERAQIGLLLVGALAAPLGTVGLYFLVDRAIRR